MRCQVAAAKETKQRQCVPHGYQKGFLRLKEAFLILALFRRQIECYCGVVEVAFVRTVAEGFVLGHATAADRYQGAALQAVHVTLRIYYFEVAVHFEGAIAIDGNFCCSHKGVGC